MDTTDSHEMEGITEKVDHRLRTETPPSTTISNTLDNPTSQPSTTTTKGKEVRLDNKDDSVKTTRPLQGGMGKRDPSSRSREDFPTLLLPTNEERGTNRTQYIKKKPRT
jgi:hypothetical protein